MDGAPREAEEVRVAWCSREEDEGIQGREEEEKKKRGIERFAALIEGQSGTCSGRPECRQRVTRGKRKGRARVGFDVGAAGMPRKIFKRSGAGTEKILKTIFNV